MQFFRQSTFIFAAVLCLFAASGSAQQSNVEVPFAEGQQIEIVNMFGRIEVIARSANEQIARIRTSAEDGVAASEIVSSVVRRRMRIDVVPSSPRKRIDLTIELPERASIFARTTEGEIRVTGNFASVSAETDTGTIAVDLPDDDLRYTLSWTASRPRTVADFPLERVRERSAGRFVISGRHRSEKTGDEPRNISLTTSTARGIVILNVPPDEVMGDLRERPLTEAAKAMIRSGDRVMMDAIRRAAPKYFGDYERTLPPMVREPQLARATGPANVAAASILRATVTVTDLQNRAVPDLAPTEFEVLENGRPREVLSVRQMNAPVNLVLLLDVSGSIENYVNFIRKAARAFVETVEDDDRISIVIFNEDIKVLAGFSTDRRMLSESLDSFDAGGATAYYDALGYAISESLRPLRGERTAIVVLTDGDDNRSFLPFESLIGAIEESGALIYPLYVPSTLIAASAASGFQDIDPLRNRHLTLTSKANAEGRRLAEASGGVYYPITQLSQIQRAYDDIVLQLRTAYEVTYRSDSASSANAESGNNLRSPRLRIRVSRPDSFVKIGPVVPAEHSR